MKVKTITLTVKPDDYWGFSDLLADLEGEPEEVKIEEVIALAQEDIASLVDDAVWAVEFDLEEQENG